MSGDEQQVLVARFADTVLLSTAAAERIADWLARYAGQLPPCRERTDLIALTDSLRSTDAAHLRKVSESVSVQRPQCLSCHDQPRDAGIRTTAEEAPPRDASLSSTEAADILGITAHGVRYLARTEALRAVRTPSGRWLFDAQAVRRRAQRNQLPLGSVTKFVWAP